MGEERRRGPSFLAGENGIDLRNERALERDPMGWNRPNATSLPVGPELEAPHQIVQKDNRVDCRWQILAGHVADAAEVVGT